MNDVVDGLVGIPRYVVEISPFSLLTQSSFVLGPTPHIPLP